MPFAKPNPNAFLRYVTLSTIAFLLFGVEARASTKNMCDEAAIFAANETSVPLSVLLAVTRTETGRTQGEGLEPWPWAVNANGQGSWHPSKIDAERTAKEFIQSGRKNIDIGCFQLNYRWHGHAFSSISQMLDPHRNAIYAANFLSRLFGEKGDWTKAVGAFHSRTLRFSDKYIKKYAAIYADIQDDKSLLPRTSTSPRQPNRFPLLKPTTVAPLRGSLVPLDSTTNRPSLLSRNGEI